MKIVETDNYGDHPEPIMKPVLSLKAAVLFYQIVAYVRRHRVRREWLSHAASDVMDGLCLDSDSEVKELKRKRLIGSYHVGDKYPNNGWTWYLTDYGCEVVSHEPFAPDYVI